MAAFQVHERVRPTQRHPVPLLSPSYVHQADLRSSCKVDGIIQRRSQGLHLLVGAVAEIVILVFDRLLESDGAIDVPVSPPPQQRAKTDVCGQGWILAAEPPRRGREFVRFERSLDVRDEHHAQAAIASAAKRLVRGEEDMVDGIERIRQRIGEECRRIVHCLLTSLAVVQSSPSETKTARSAAAFVLLLVRDSHLASDSAGIPTGARFLSRSSDIPRRRGGGS